MVTQLKKNLLQKQHLMGDKWSFFGKRLTSFGQRPQKAFAYLFVWPIYYRKYSVPSKALELKTLINSPAKAFVSTAKPTIAVPFQKRKSRPSSRSRSLRRMSRFAWNAKLNKKQFKTSRTKNKSVEALPKNTNLFCLISINRTKNNTHAIISNLFGENKTKWSISAGQFKLPGGRRKTRLSQRMVYKSCLEKALSFGYKFSVIHCRGTRGSKARIFRFFGDSLSVLLIKDTTGVAHNGCRPPKVRRV